MLRYDDAALQRRQHALRPNPGFDTTIGPAGSPRVGLCASGSSPASRGRIALSALAVLRCFGLDITFPPSYSAFPRHGLCCPCFSRFAPQRYYAGSDSCPARTHRTGLSASFALPSEYPAPNHIVSLNVAFTVTSAHQDRPVGPGFAVLRQARHITPPKRVRYPAGYSFASGCSPPRIAATQ